MRYDSRSLVWTDGAESGPIPPGLCRADLVDWSAQHHASRHGWQGWPAWEGHVLVRSRPVPVAEVPLTVRAPRSEVAAWRAAARGEGRSLSDWLRGAARRSERPGPPPERCERVSVRLDPETASLLGERPGETLALRATAAAGGGR